MLHVYIILTLTLTFSGMTPYVREKDLELLEEEAYRAKMREERVWSEVVKEERKGEKTEKTETERVIERDIKRDIEIGPYRRVSDKVSYINDKDQKDQNQKISTEESRKGDGAPIDEWW
jgi:hypothetical protein